MLTLSIVAGTVVTAGLAKFGKICYDINKDLQNFDIEAPFKI